MEKKTPWIKNISFFLIGVFLLFLAFKSQDVKAILNSFLLVNYKWILIGKLFTLSAHWIRGYRWKLLIEKLNYKPKSSNLYHAVMSGYFANLAIPRLGEFVRCGAVQKMEGVDYNKLLGSVVAERAVDMILLAILLIVAMFGVGDELVQFFSSKIFFVGENNDSFKLVYALGLVIVILIIGLIIIFNSKTENVFVNKIKAIINGMKKGVLTVFTLKKKTGLFFGLSILIWIGYLLNFFFCMKGIPGTENISLWNAFIVLMFSGLSMLAPVQGGIGAFHWMVMQAFIIIGVNAETGLAAATILHASNIALLLIAGGISTLYISLKYRKQHLNTNF